MLFFIFFIFLQFDRRDFDGYHPPSTPNLPKAQYNLLIISTLVKIYNSLTPKVKLRKTQLPYFSGDKYTIFPQNLQAKSRKISP
jgi:hypothetical protein